MKAKNTKATEKEKVAKGGKNKFAAGAKMPLTALLGSVPKKPAKSKK
jgi:hypothetical protein